LGYIQIGLQNQGFHKGDSVLVVSDSVFKKKQLDFAHSQLDSLQDHPVKKPSNNNIIDFYIIQNQLKNVIF
jgi:hypothetical protein